MFKVWYEESDMDHKNKFCILGMKVTVQHSQMNPFCEIGLLHDGNVDRKDIFVLSPSYKSN